VAWLYTDKEGDYNVWGTLDEALSTTGQIFVSKFMIAVKLTHCTWVRATTLHSKQSRTSCFFKDSRDGHTIYFKHVKLVWKLQ